ncbi:MAG: ABC transporter substrate-binding protein [Rhodobacteraceae bacterium]|nr:ABC transporter substrate-binding protein [Paracoccaceae bacterium]
MHRPLIAAATTIALFLPGAALAQTELRFALPTSGSGDALNALVETYAAANPDVRITVQRFPAGPGYGQGILTQLQSGAGADLMFVNGGFGALEALMPLAKNGQLVDLSGSAWAADIPEGARAAYMIGDAVYGLPLSLIAVGAVYNPAVLARLGIEYPRSLDDLMAACALAPEQGINFSSSLGTSPFYMILANAVGTVYADQPDWNARRAAGEVTFANTPGWAEAFAIYRQMSEANCFQPGYQAATIPDVFAAMAGEQVVSGVGPSTLAGAVMRMNPTVTLQMAPWPAGDKLTAIGFFNDAVAVNAASGNVDAARALVDWLAQPEQLRAYASSAGGIATVDIGSGNYAPLVAGLASYFDAGEFVTLPHVEWERREVLEALNRGAGALSTGQMTIEQVLAGLDAAWGN